MKLSIVVPAYNAAKYLGATLDSALAQTWRDWELLVVDDGSKDETVRVAQRYAERDERIRFVRKENAGVSAARNLGYARCSPQSEYIIFLDADDVWEPDTLETLLATLDAQPNAVAAYGLARYINSAGALCREGELEAQFRRRFQVVGKRLAPLALERPADFATLAVSNCIATMGVILLRKSALERAGLFEEGLHYCEDWDVWLRLARLGEFAFLNRVVLGYRVHDTNATTGGRAMIEGGLYVRRKLMANETDPERLRMAQVGFRFHSALIAKDLLRASGRYLKQGEYWKAAQTLRHALRVSRRYRVEMSRFAREGVGLPPARNARSTVG